MTHMNWKRLGMSAAAGLAMAALALPRVLSALPDRTVMVAGGWLMALTRFTAWTNTWNRWSTL